MRKKSSEKEKDMNSERFRRILLHEEHGPSAICWRCFLETVRPFYALAVWLRNRSFDRHPERTFHAAVPVLSIGNLTLGGTGKSPVVFWIARELLLQGRKIAVLSRGYKSKEQNREIKQKFNQNQKNESNPETDSETNLETDFLNDEGRELAKRLPEVVQLQNPNRCESARCAVEKWGAEVLLLDDGFQHRKLYRDGNIVLVDASEPFGLTGRLFPCGTLREPMRELRRADVLILTHAEQLSLRERHTLREELETRFPSPKKRLWVETTYEPTGLAAKDGSILTIAEAQNRFSKQKIGAFCGIGKPTGLFETLKRAGLEPASTKNFADHQVYGTDETREIVQWAQTEGLEVVICTEKDAVKLKPELFQQLPLFSLRAEVSFLEGREIFQEWILSKIRKK